VKDPARAVELFRKAAGSVYPDEAMNDLGNCYRDGTGVDRSDENAEFWYRSAAEHGNADGMCNLGRCYETGRGVRADRAEAIRWYRRADARGSKDAKDALRRLGG
jgi:TPR repeat protein